MSEGFALDWLAKREAVDLAARNPILARAFADYVRGIGVGRPLQIIDLGSGSGASFRALAPLIAIDQEWILIELAPDLLAVQTRMIAAWAGAKGWPVETGDDGGITVTGPTDCGAGGRWRARARRLDLARDLGQLDAMPCDAMTSAAFIDLVSGRWLEALAQILSARRLPFLGVLAVDGRRLWQPAEKGDGRLQEGFVLSQTADKGFGPALGPRAPRFLEASLSGLGFAVTTGFSDWHLGPEDGALLAELLAGEAAAAARAMPNFAPLFDQWERSRERSLAAGRLRAMIGHLDLLALPR